MLRLNFDQVRTFLAVARLGGTNKASSILHLSQPAVTARIKNLEAALGKTLFERTPAGMSLTKDGELLLRYAEGFENLEGLVQRNVVDANATEGLLRIGASETITQCWLPEFVTRLHRCFPKLNVDLNVDISANLRQSLLDREIDLAFLLGPISDYRVDNLPLPEFALAWYRAAGSAPPLESVDSYLMLPVITYMRHTRPYRELRAKLLDHVGPQATLFPSSSLSASFRLVEAGIGVAALPRSLAGAFLERGTIREFDPGWVPDPLRFTASYMADPASQLVEKACEIALDVARAHAGYHDG